MGPVAKDNDDRVAVGGGLQVAMDACGRVDGGCGGGQVARDACDRGGGGVGGRVAMNACDRGGGCRVEGGADDLVAGDIRPPDEGGAWGLADGGAGGLVAAGIWGQVVSCAVALGGWGTRVGWD